MNYLNYEDAIMQGRKCKIISWPHLLPFASPSTIGNLKDMCTLYDGWMMGSIRWVRVSNAKVKAHAEDLEMCRAEGETIGKKHKRRSNKNVLWKWLGTATTKPTTPKMTTTCPKSPRSLLNGPSPRWRTRWFQRANKHCPKMQIECTNF